MTTLLVTRGLPAAGKTTFARAWVAAEPGRRARVNRDEASLTLYGRSWGLTRAQDAAVTVALFATIRALLGAGFDVVFDDTNLSEARIEALAELAEECHARLIVRDEFLQVPLEELIGRDNERRRRGPRAVGETTIRHLHPTTAVAPSSAIMGG